MSFLTVAYRAAQVSGSSDTQAVEFNNVAAANTAVVGAAQLNIGAGIETGTANRFQRHHAEQHGLC